MFAGLSRLAATDAAAAGCLGGGGSWPHAPPPVVGMDGNGNSNCDCLREKGVGQGGGEGELKDDFVFIHCFYF